MELTFWLGDILLQKRGGATSEAMESYRKVQFGITASALVVAIVHLWKPNLNIDSITVVLIVVAIVPWLAPLFRSMELPGGFKFEFNDFERIKKEAKEVGLINDALVSKTPEYSFLEIAESNPQLALVGLRIELEKGLRTLAGIHNVNTERPKARFLMTDLYNRKLISEKERAVLADMMSTLNQAAHGHEADPRITNWIIEVGPKILDSINKKITNSRINI